MATRNQCQCYKSRKEQTVRCPHKARLGTLYCGYHQNCPIVNDPKKSLGQVVESHKIGHRFNLEWMKSDLITIEDYLKKYKALTPSERDNLNTIVDQKIGQCIDVKQLEPMIRFCREISRHYLDGPVIGIGESPNKILTIQEALDWKENRDQKQRHLYFQLPISDLSGHQTIYERVNPGDYYADKVKPGQYYLVNDYNGELKRHQIGAQLWRDDMRLVEINQFLEMYPKLQLDLLSSFLYIDETDKPAAEFTKTINQKETMIGLYQLMREQGVAPEQLIRYPHVNFLDFAHTGSSITTFLHILRTLSPPGLFPQLLQRIRYIVLIYSPFDPEG